MSAARPASGPFVVGLTGGIGSGKSVVAQEFARLGAEVVDTDAIAHELTAAGGAAMPALAQLLGKECVLPSGALDRAKVRARVFSDPAARKALETLLHPLIRQRSDEQIAAVRGPYVIHVVPLLVESKNYRARADRVLVVDATEPTQIARVRERGLGEDEIRAIVRSQASRAERRDAADDLIENEGSLDALRQRVAELHAKYLALAADAKR